MSYPLSVAPMIQWTDRHWRYLMRSITRSTLLYTEMNMDVALINNSSNLEDFLGHHNGSKLNYDPYPIAVQLGGCNAEHLGEAAYLCESHGPYSSINLNAGCPSKKAKKCGFGAELMLEPLLVRQIVSSMIRRVSHTEVTVKCRIGVAQTQTQTTKEDYSWNDLVEFVEAVREGGVRHMIIHSRMCILQGLSPAQNRTVPPLRYDAVHRLVERFPEMRFTLNGGIETFPQVAYHLGATIPLGLDSIKSGAFDPKIIIT
jgi:tRNA-dihydrouridine synthase A